ncbi:hypothetical protein [Prosthecobacter sp.]|uniref:hypothetical protein n=1 Tax=Prosthecobacter sp. TaxID=1965333 RepID=UPI0037850FD4
MKRLNFYQIIFILTAVLILLFKLSVSQPAHVDEIFFKAPAVSWASGTGWRSPEEPNYGGWQPPLNDVFASYPPVYPFLFSCCIKVFGFSWRVCAGYDAIVHTLLAGVLVFFLRSVLPSRPVIAWLAGWLFLLSGNMPRPDQLAMSFGYGSLALTFRTQRWTWRSLALSGLLFGFCLGTSVPCSVALAPLFGAVLLGRHCTFRQTANRVAIMGVVAAVTALIIVLPVWLYHHGALEQNINATADITNYEFTSSLGNLLRYWYPTLLAFGIFTLPGIWSLGVILQKHEKQRLASWLLWYGSALLPLAFFFIKSTSQGAYYWFFMPWLIAALFHFHLRETHLARWWFVLLVAGFLPLAVTSLRSMLVAKLTVSDKRIDAFRQIIEDNVPKGASVVCGGDYWWLLARRNRVYDILDHAALRTDQVDYIIVTGIGSGTADLHHALPPFASDGHYQLIHFTRETSLSSLFGIPLSRSTSSPAPSVYRRKDTL